MHHSRRIACICGSLGMLLLLGQMPADAALTDNAVTQNALAGNSITSNSITSNSITSNSITSNSITSNGVAASGLSSALADLNGVAVEAASLPDQQHQ